MSGKAGKSLLLPHRFWEQISLICMTSHTLDLNLKRSPRQFHKRWNLEFFKEGKIKHHPCLGKSTEADSACVYEHGSDYLCMLEGGRNIFIFLCTYLYAFMRYRNSWALTWDRSRKKETSRRWQNYTTISTEVCYVRTWRQRDQQGELSTERHRYGSLCGLASLRSTEEKLVRPCIQNSTPGQHSCEDFWFIRGQEAEQVGQEWYLCCWQFCCALCGYNAIREAGQKGIDALWHCLNERKLCKGPAGG